MTDPRTPGDDARRTAAGRAAGRQAPVRPPPPHRRQRARRDAGRAAPRRAVQRAGDEEDRARAAVRRRAQLPPRARRPARRREPLALPRPAGAAHGLGARQAGPRPRSDVLRRRGRAHPHADQGRRQAGAEGRQAAEDAAGEAAAQAVQGSPDAPVHRRRLHDGPAGHGAHQPLQQDQADQAAARLPHLHRAGAARLLQLAGAGPAAGQGVRPGRRGRDVRRQRQPGGADLVGQDLPVRQRRLEEGVPQARGGHDRPALPGRRAPRVLDRPAGDARRRRSTARSS